MELTTPLLRPSLFRTLFFVAITATAFVLADSVLANTERSETARAAAALYDEGRSLMQQQRYAEALQPLRSAIADERGNTAYPLALGEALMSQGDTTEAAEVLTDLLKTDAMAGAPNLAMARVLKKEGQYDTAAFYYHRAIYGQWKNDPVGNRTRARFELADFLAERNLKAELLAELLPLQEEAATDVATQERIARLFMTAGSPVRAAAVYSDLAHSDPHNAAVQRDLAAAQLARGDYFAALQAYRSAHQFNPSDAQSESGLALTERILNLDPQRRGLTASERFSRSLNVLQLVIGKAKQCGSADSQLAPAEAAVSARVAPAVQTETSESNFELAARLWRSIPATCTASVGDDEQALQLLLARPTP